MRSLTFRARNLRADSTDAERLLWRRLRAHRLNGFKFKRQQPIGRFIVDFVRLQAKLIVEVDGGQHTAADDHARDAALVPCGFRVLRFWNNEVLTNIDGVVQRISDSLPPSPPPSPIKGEGVRPRICRETAPASAIDERGLQTLRSESTS